MTVGLTPIDKPPSGTATPAIYRKGLVLAFDVSACANNERVFFDYYDSTDYQIAGVSVQATQDPTIDPQIKHSALSGQEIVVQRFGYADVTCSEDNLEIDVGEVVGAEADTDYQSNADESGVTVATVDEIRGGTGITQIPADPGGDDIHKLFDELSASVGVALEHAEANYGAYDSNDPDKRREIMVAMWLIPDFQLTNA